MSFNLPGEANPFEAPRAGIGEGALYGDLADNDAELIRREHLGRESNIKSLGNLNYLGAFFGVFGTIAAALMATGLMPTPPNQAPGVDPSMQKLTMGIAAVFYLLGTALNGALGYGLTHFQVWARWTTVVFTSIGLLYVAVVSVFLMATISPIPGVIVLVVGGGINGLILWLLVSSKAGVVFSKEYKEVIRKTPHIKQKISIIVKILLGILITIIGLGVIGAIIGALMNR